MGIFGFVGDVIKGVLIKVISLILIVVLFYLAIKFFFGIDILHLIGY
jgi:5-bromo-4-chloroindolyl phosphate hydrolysis protein